ncbi:hypothetical protein [Faecalibacter sp. LW9]|uniref:hypothetical protein n=1 Tax=Faecalibacter sp. LW9 TaxID=3103144 RepID=UPI002AFE37AB|nr:hypothetical protein [Faecalibacter sp. LW9]
MMMIYGKNEEITQTLARVIQRTYAVSCSVPQNLTCLNQILSSSAVEVIILSSGVGQSEIELLYQMVDGRCKIIHHYGGGSGLLKSEIELSRRNIQSSSCIISNNHLL